MAKAKVTKKQLLSSSLALVVSGAMLIGTTMAWFTDSKTSGLNTIKAGKIALGVTYESGSQSGDLTSDTELFKVEDMQPGDTGSFLLTVTNSGSIDAKVKLDFDITDKGLINYLWFSVDDDNEEHPMSELETYNFEKTLKKSSTSTTPVTYTLKYGMYNDVRQADVAKKQFAAYVTVNATQVNGAYDVLNYSTIDNATSGDTVDLSSETYIGISTLKNGVNLAGTAGTVLETAANGLALEGNSTISNLTIKAPAELATNGKIVNINGSGTTLDSVNIAYNGNKQIAVNVTENSNAKSASDTTIIGSTITGYKGIYVGALSTNSKLTVENSTVEGLYPIHIENSTKTGELVVKDSTLKGWTSYTGIDSATFTNTTFEKGSVSKWNYLRPYVNTVLDGCTFGDDFRFCQVAEGGSAISIYFNDCKLADGTPVTAKIVKELIDQKEDGTSYDYVMRNYGTKIYVDGVEINY